MLTFYNCDFDTTKSLPFKTCVQHGEDCQFQININVGGVPAASLSDYTWTAVYQDVSCLSVYYTVDAQDVSLNSETNAVDLYFRHKYDMGAIAYRIFVYGTKGEENTVPAVIDLGMLPNPLFSASHVEPVPPTIDFSQYNLVNAPWTELSDFYALSAEVKQDMANYLPLSGGTMSGNLSMSAGKGIVFLRDARPGTIYGDGSITTRNPAEPAPRFRLTLPIKNDTLAVVGDIPSLDGYATESYVDQNLSGKLDKSELSDYVPTSRKVNGVELTGDVALNADSVSALPATYVPLQGNYDVNAHPVFRNAITIWGNSTVAEGYMAATTFVGDYLAKNPLATPLEIPIAAEAGDMVARTSDLCAYMPKSMESSFVPTSRTVNGKALSANVSLTAADVGAATTQYVDEGLSGKLDLTGGTIDGEVWVGSLEAGELHLDFPVVILNDGRGFEFPNESVAPEGGTIATTADLPAPQVNSDWNATSGVAEILNKPNIIPVTVDSGSYVATSAVNQFALANSDQSKVAYFFVPQDVSDTRTAYVYTNGTVVGSKLQKYVFGAPANPLAIPAGADANDAIARTSDLPPFETWTFTLNDNTTVTKKVAIYS
jgi:hypothetical protein